MFYTNVVRNKNDIYMTYYEDNSFDRKLIKTRYKPSIFLKSDKPSKYKTIDNENVSLMKFESISECSQFVYKYQNVENFDMYGNIWYQYAYISDVFKDEINYNIDKIKVCVLDIETECEVEFSPAEFATERINAITLYDIQKNIFYTFGLQDLTIEQENVQYNFCETEEELLYKFLTIWRELNIDILTGWNIVLFDIIYLVNRMNNILGSDQTKLLSPFEIVQPSEFRFRQKSYPTYDIFGITILDYEYLYKKYFTDEKPSFSLNSISELELKDKKLDYSEFMNHREFYTENYEKFIKYNIKDTELVKRLNDKLRLLEVTYFICYIAKCNLSDIFSATRIWDCYLFNELKRNNFAIPFKKHFDEKTEQYEGGFVLDSIPGKYEWVVSYDFTSLYPSIMATFNISMETKVGKIKNLDLDKLINGSYQLDKLKKENISMCANGLVTKREKGTITKTILYLYNERIVIKKKIKQLKKQLDILEKGQ